MDLEDILRVESLESNIYNYEIINYSLDTSRHISWSKLLLMKKLIQETDYEYYVWIDDDIYISNLDITIESFIEKYSFENILISDDPCNGNVYSCNSGIFICKKKLHKKIIDKIHNCRHVNFKFYNQGTKKCYLD